MRYIDTHMVTPQDLPLNSSKTLYVSLSYKVRTNASHVCFIHIIWIYIYMYIYDMSICTHAFHVSNYAIDDHSDPSHHSWLRSMGHSRVCATEACPTSSATTRVSGAWRMTGAERCGCWAICRSKAWMRFYGMILNHRTAWGSIGSKMVWKNQYRNALCP